MQSGDLGAIVSIGVLATVVLVLALRARALREKDFRVWLAYHRESNPNSVAEMSHLRGQWKIDRAARESARRAAHRLAQGQPTGRDLPASADADLVHSGMLSAGPDVRHPVATHSTQGPSVAATAVERDRAASTNTMALVSLIFSLLGGLLGIVFGHVAMSHIKRTGEGGRGLATAGLVLGYVWLLVYVAIGIAVVSVAVAR